MSTKFWKLLPAWLLVAWLVTALLVTALLVTAAGAASQGTMEQKLAYLRENSVRAQADPRPTEFTEQEINAFLANGGLKLPAGVQSLRFEGQPGVVTSFAKIDFEEVRAGGRSMNPLLSIFSGRHDVVVVAHGQGARGEATLHIDAVRIDEVEVPNFLLVLFAQRFITPKYPELGVDSRFRLPARIDTATVGAHVLTVRQKDSHSP